MTEREEIEAILDSFTTDGYKFMLEDIKKHYDAISNIDGVKDERDLYFLQGQRHSLKWILNMEAWYQNALDNLDGDV